MSGARSSSTSTLRSSAMLQFQATILMTPEFIPTIVKSRCLREDREHEEAVARPRRCRLGVARRIGGGVSIRSDFPPGRPGILEAASHRLGGQERLGKMR